MSTSISPVKRFYSNLPMIKRDSDLYQQHLQYEIRDYFLPEKIGKHALIWEQYQRLISRVEINDSVGLEVQGLNTVWYWEKSSLIVLSIAAISVCVLHIIWLTSKKCKKSNPDEKPNSENSNDTGSSESTTEHTINNIWVYFRSFLGIIYNVKSYQKLRNHMKSIAICSSLEGLQLEWTI